MKKFKDIGIGDIVWLIDNYKIYKRVVKDIFHITGIKFIFESGDCYYIFSIKENECQYRNQLFTQFDTAIIVLKQKIKSRIKQLEEKIDLTIQKIELYKKTLENIEVPENCSTTKKFIKAVTEENSSVWYVDKKNLNIKKAKIKQYMSVAFNCYRVVVEIEEMVTFFYVYIGSYKSTNGNFHVTQETAIRELSWYIKERITALENQMDGSIKKVNRLEHYLLNENIWRT